MVHVVTRVPLNTLRKGTAFLGCGAPPYILGVRLFNARSVRCSAGWVPGEKGTTMSERTPKLPLNNPEYTVPEYSVLLPSNEPESSTVEGDGTSNNTATNNAAPTGAVDNNAAEDNAPSNGAPEHATTGYRDATAGYVAAPNMRVGYDRRLCVAPSGAPPRLLFCRFSPLSSSSCSSVNQSPVWRRYLTLSCVCWDTLSSLFLSRFASSG